MIWGYLDHQRCRQNLSSLSLWSGLGNASLDLKQDRTQSQAKDLEWTMCVLRYLLRKKSGSVGGFLVETGPGPGQKTGRSIWQVMDAG